MKRQCEEQTLESGETCASHCRHCAWTAAEDGVLLRMAANGRVVNWNLVARELESVSPSASRKSARQCRERWNNRVNPSIKTAPWSEEEVTKFFDIHGKMGSRWSEIAAVLPGRTDNTIKNFFFCRLRKVARRISKDAVTPDMTTSPSEIERILYLIDHLRTHYLSGSANTEQRDRYIAEMVRNGTITAEKLDKYLADHLGAMRVHSQPASDKVTGNDDSTRSHSTLPSISECLSPPMLATKRACLAHSADVQAELEKWRAAHPKRDWVELPLPAEQGWKLRSAAEDGFRPTLFDSVGPSERLWSLTTAIEIVRRKVW